MRRKIKKRTALILLICFLAGMMAAAVFLATPGYGKGITGKIRNTDGDLFIVRDGKIRVGAFRYKGKLYYGHKKKTSYYPTGSLTVRAFRVIGRKVYYFDKDGAAITRSTRYIKLKRGSVDHWYIPGTGFKQMFDVKERRYMFKVGNTWVPVGMQVWPDGQFDRGE